MFVLEHRSVVSLSHEAGIDSRSVALWNFLEAVEDDETLRSEDPLQIAVMVSFADGTLTLELDENFDVVEHGRDARRVSFLHALAGIADEQSSI